jgi:hypothetical protein
VALAASHAVIAILFATGFGWVLHERLLFPQLVLRRTLRLHRHHKAEGEYHPVVSQLPFMNPSDKEIAFIFSAIDKERNTGKITIDMITAWISSNMRPPLNSTDALRLRGELEGHLSGDASPADFNRAFGYIIKALVGMRLHAPAADLEDPVSNEPAQEESVIGSDGDAQEEGKDLLWVADGAKDFFPFAEERKNDFSPVLPVMFGRAGRQEHKTHVENDKGVQEPRPCDTTLQLEKQVDVPLSIAPASPLPWPWAALCEGLTWWQCTDASTNHRNLQREDQAG